MVETYREIGQRILLEEQKGKERADCGLFLIKELFIKLGDAFGKGFSQSNLRNFRQFYLAFPNEEIRYILFNELSWSHNRLIKRLEMSDAQQYCLKESIEQNWSVRTLQRNIKTQDYERLLSTQNKSELETRDRKQSISDFVKDPYVFEFLNIAQSHIENESDIVNALIGNLKEFLLELGKDFSFVGRQF